MRFLLCLVVVLVSICLSVEAAKNGCWENSVKNIKINNCTPNPTKKLCSACPLRTGNVKQDGHFSDCEYCCDAVSCGIGNKSYKQVKKANNLKLIDTKRHNAPLHIYYDNCAMYPDQKQKIGRGKFVNTCTEVTAWFRGNRSNVKPDLAAALKRLAKRYGCAKKKAWSPCASMERKQKRVQNNNSQNCKA